MCDTGRSCEYDYCPSNVWDHGYIVDLTPLEDDETEKTYEGYFPHMQSQFFYQRDAYESSYQHALFRHHKEAVAYVKENNLSKKRIQYCIPDVYSSPPHPFF